MIEYTCPHDNCGDARRDTCYTCGRNEKTMRYTEIPRITVKFKGEWFNVAGLWLTRFGEPERGTRPLLEETIEFGKDDERFECMEVEA